MIKTQITLLIIVWLLTACTLNPPSQPLPSSQPSAPPSDAPVLPTETSVLPTLTPLPVTNTPEATVTMASLADRLVTTATPTQTQVGLTGTPETTSSATQILTTTIAAAATDAVLSSQTPSPDSSTTASAEASSAEAHFEAGLLYFDQEQWEQAISEFEAAIQLDPEFGQAYGFLGYSYASGPGRYEEAVAALEKYLELVPEAVDRAKVEGDIQFYQELLTSRPDRPEFEAPPGKALFVFFNYSDITWQIEVGPYQIKLPAWQDGKKYPIGQAIIEPGTYTWRAYAPDEDFYIVDGSGNNSFEFTVAAGEVYVESVGGPPP